MAEYHRIRLIIVNENNNMLTYRQSISLGEQLYDPSSSPPRMENPGTGPSGAVRYTMEDLDLVEKTLRILDEKEQLALEG